MKVQSLDKNTNLIIDDDNKNIRYIMLTNPILYSTFKYSDACKQLRQKRYKMRLNKHAVQIND